jgi:hypothetical protein
VPFSDTRLETARVNSSDLGSRLKPPPPRAVVSPSEVVEIGDRTPVRGAVFQRDMSRPFYVWSVVAARMSGAGDKVLYQLSYLAEAKPGLEPGTTPLTVEVTHPFAPLL